MINIDEMKEFLGGDEEFIARIIEKFILEVGNDLEKLRLASNENNYTMVRALAHKMLSSTRIFGIHEFSDRLETMETLAEEKKN